MDINDSIIEWSKSENVKYLNGHIEKRTCDTLQKAIK